MKKLLILLSIIFFFGCAPLQTTRTETTNIYPPFDEEVEAHMGDAFFSHETWVKVTITPTYSFAPPTYSGNKFDLTIVELNDEKLGLQYAEYMKGVYGGWLIKQGFNKRFDYDLNNKVIHFKEYEFKVLSFGDGKIQYKRIK